MSIVIPPKTPAKLALYCVALYFGISLVWDLILGLPVAGTSVFITLMFVVVGYMYGKHHGALSFKSACVTALYCTLPLIALRLLPIVVGALSEIPENEIAIFLVIAVIIGGVATLVHGLFIAFLLSFASKFSVKQQKQ